MVIMGSKEDKKNEEQILKELVLARIDVMPSNFKLSVGDEGVFTKEQIMSLIEEDTPIGKQIIEMQLSFIKALTSGELTKAIVK